MGLVLGADTATFGGKDGHSGRIAWCGVCCAALSPEN